MQIAVMEQQISPPSGGSKTPPGGGDWAQRTCPANWSSTTSNVKKAKANRVSGKTHMFQCRLSFATRQLCLVPSGWGGGATPTPGFEAPKLSILGPVKIFHNFFWPYFPQHIISLIFCYFS